MIKPVTISMGTVGQPRLSRDGRTMVISIPITMRRTGGRKKVITPANAAPWSPPPARVDSTIVKALVRAHRWRDMLESGDYATVRDLAKTENINESYLGRVMRLTLLAPKIVEAILEGKQPPSLDLEGLLKKFPVEWSEQLEARSIE